MFQVTFPGHEIIYISHSDGVSKTRWLGGTRQLPSAENPTHQHLLNTCKVLELLWTEFNNNSNTSLDESYWDFKFFLLVSFSPWRKQRLALFRGYLLDRVSWLRVQALVGADLFSLSSLLFLYLLCFTLIFQQFMKSLTDLGTNGRCPQQPVCIEPLWLIQPVELCSKICVDLAVYFV